MQDEHDPEEWSPEKEREEDQNRLLRDAHKWMERAERDYQAQVAAQKKHDRDRAHVPSVQAPMGTGYIREIQNGFILIYHKAPTMPPPSTDVQEQSIRGYIMERVEVFASSPEDLAKALIAAIKDRPPKNP